MREKREIWDAQFEAFLIGNSCWIAPLCVAHVTTHDDSIEREDESDDSSGIFKPEVEKSFSKLSRLKMSILPVTREITQSGGLLEVLRELWGAIFFLISSSFPFTHPVDSYHLYRVVPFTGNDFAVFSANCIVPQGLSVPLLARGHSYAHTMLNANTAIPAARCHDALKHLISDLILVSSCHLSIHQEENLWGWVCRGDGMEKSFIAIISIIGPRRACVRVKRMLFEAEIRWDSWGVTPLSH